jgi:hypothetical protein
MARNYYPVSSAISVDDKNSEKRVTVLNDRAQGGSADLSVKGAIELMQHRRLVFADDLGVKEPLNETDWEDVGLRVNAVYYMEIATKTDSRFRNQQELVNQPIQYLHATNFTLANQSDPSTKVSSAIMNDNFSTIKLYPIGRNHILVRLENFSNSTKSMDLAKYARGLYQEQNGGKNASDVKIEEVTLSGN